MNLFAVAALAIAAAAPEAPAPVAAADSRQVRLTYNGRMAGLRVMKATFDVDLAADSFAAVSGFRAAGLAGFFKSSTVSSDTTGRLVGGRVKPGDYHHVEVSGDKRREIVLRRRRGEVKVRARPRLGSLGEPPASEDQKREALDPLAAWLAIMLESPAAPCDRRVPVFDSKLRYDLVFTSGGVDDIRTRGYAGPAEKCVVRYRPIAGYDPEDLADEDVYKTPIYVWLATVEPGVRAPVRVAASFRAGVVRVPMRVELTRVVVAPADEAG